MTRTGENVRSLVAEDSSFADALSTVLDRAGHTGEDAEPDGGAQPHTVRWGDVSDELTSGQWGRLIETGILYDADGDGFAVSNPDEVRGALGDDTTEAAVAADADEEDSGWSTYDKLAGLCALALFPSYFVTPIRNVVGGVANLVLGPFDAVLPFYAVIIVLSVITGLYSVLLQSNLMDTEKMGAIQEKMNDIQERRDAAEERGDDAELERIQQEQMDAMGDQLGMFKTTFRPMVWILLITIPLFVWMYWMLGVRGGGVERVVAAERQIVMPIIGQIDLTQQIGGFVWAWLVWYFLVSLSFRQVIQKTLNLQTSPNTN